MKSKLLVTLFIILVTHAIGLSKGIKLKSPDGEVRCTVEELNGSLQYSLQFKKQPIITNSPLGIKLNKKPINNEANIYGKSRVHVTRLHHMKTPQHALYRK